MFTLYLVPEHQLDSFANEWNGLKPFYTAGFSILRTAEDADRVLAAIGPTMNPPPVIIAPSTAAWASELVRVADRVFNAYCIKDRELPT